MRLQKIFVFVHPTLVDQFADLAARANQSRSSLMHTALAEGLPVVQEAVAASLAHARVAGRATGVDRNDPVFLPGGRRRGTRLPSRKAAPSRRVEDPLATLRRFGAALLKGNPDLPEGTFKTMLYDEAASSDGPAAGVPRRDISDLALALMKAVEPNLLTPVTEDRPPESPE